MVGNQQEFGSKGILEELVRYVFENKGNRLLIIGDTAQLPPVGTDLSLALKAEEMRMRYGLDVVEHELSDVVRQELDSGILENATALREVIRGVKQGFVLKTAGYPDIFKMSSNRVFEGIEYAYAKYGMEKTLVLTRTNKQAMQYNRGIRGHILYREEELESGDWVIVVKNNYSILDNESKTGFVANGDLCTVRRVGRSLDDYPLKLVSLELTLSDVNEEDEPLDGYAFTELLYSDLPQLSEEQVRIFQQVLMAEWELEEKSVRKRWAKMKTDPVANALQIKFGYADHSINIDSSIACSVAAIGAGADIIEKHITIKSKKPLEDSESAIIDKDFLILKKKILLAWEATNYLPIKKTSFGMSNIEKKYKISVRRVFVTNKKLNKGYNFKNNSDLDLKRSSLKGTIYNFQNIKNKELIISIPPNTPITKKIIK
jgi:hypothetical protein